MAGPPRAVYGGRVTTAQNAPHAGLLIREWRLRRSLSQMELASGAAVSARHLSFVETGRPTRAATWCCGWTRSSSSRHATAYTC